MDPKDESAAAAPATSENQVQEQQAQAGACQLLPHDVKELENASDYAAQNENELQCLSEDVGGMGKLRLIWDSKVPKKNKKFYYFFTMKASNREDVLNEIKKYQDFYKEMSTAVRKVRNFEETTESERLNPYTIILDLTEKLAKMEEEAKSGEKSTGSSTVCELHRAFIEKHEKLENMIKRVECVALKEGLKRATDGLQESLAAIGGLRSDLQNAEKKYDNMCDRFDRLMIQNEKLLEQQSILLDNNQKMEQQQEILLQENAVIKTILKNLAKKDEREKKDDGKEEEVNGGE